MAPDELAGKSAMMLEFGSSGSCIETWDSFRILASWQNLLIKTCLGNAWLYHPAALRVSIGLKLALRRSKIRQSDSS